MKLCQYMQAYLLNVLKGANEFSPDGLSAKKVLSAKNDFSARNAFLARNSFSARYGYLAKNSF